MPSILNVLKSKKTATEPAVNQDSSITKSDKHSSWHWPLHHSSSDTITITLPSVTLTTAEQVQKTTETQAALAAAANTKDNNTTTHTTPITTGSSKRPTKHSKECSYVLFMGKKTKVKSPPTTPLTSPLNSPFTSPPESAETTPTTSPRQSVDLGKGADMERWPTVERDGCALCKALMDGEMPEGFVRIDGCGRGDEDVPKLG